MCQFEDVYKRQTHGFLVYPIATLGAGAKPVVAPETNYTVNVDAMLKAVTRCV